MNDIWKKYENIEEINKGMYKNVIKAKNKTTGEYVVIKQINKLNLKEPNKYLSFLNKMKLLSIENCISIIETYNSKDYIYIVMELCLLNLNDFIKIRNKKLSIEEIKEILFQINLTLKKMIENKIIHGNLKLSNILISLKQINHITIKLSDFYMNNNEDNYPTIAPEIIKTKKISIKNDIWSLGIIIYYLLFNEYPFNEKTKIELNEDNDLNIKIKKSGNNELDDLLKKMIYIDYNKRISWNDYFNHPFFINYINHQNLKFPESIFSNKICNDIKFRCKECPYIPLIGLFYENGEVKIESRCQNRHYNIEKIEDFYNRNSFNSFTNIKCSIGNESLNYSNELFYCNDCDIFICPNHIKEDQHNNIISLDKINNYCIEHKNMLNSFCKTCLINLCDDCKLNHLNHDIINLNSFKLNKKEIEEYKIINNKNNLNYEMIENIKNIINFKPINCEIDIIFHILTKVQKYYSFMNNNYNCILEKSKNFINIDFNITKEEKKYLLTNFKPLEENLEFIDKYNIGDYYYYGEIIRKNEEIKKHGRGIHLYSDGAKRFGYFKNGKMNGYSIEFYRDGFIKQCYRKEDTEDGFYIKKYSDGLIIKGIYKNGLGEGFNIINNPNGDITIGELKNNISGGYYLKYCLNGERYEGEMKNGNRDGIGIFTTFRSIYEGNWKNDNKDGIGKICWNNPKQKYEGEFKYNNPNGFGIQFNENKLKIYEGEFENGLYHGYGIDYYSNGSKRYDGFYINGSSCKFGICYLEDGFIFYIGYLDNNKRNGFGSYKQKPNERRIGNWKNDKGNGYYLVFNSNGSSYRGFAKDGEFEGYGIYKWSNGEIYEGEWKNSEPHGYGIYKYIDGSIYKGTWKNYNREGYGELIIPNRGKYKGEWENNVKNGFGMQISNNSNQIKFMFYQNGILVNDIF